MQKYGASKKTMNEVSEIFIQNDVRYSDPRFEAIVAGFIDNGAIKTRMVSVNRVITHEFDVRGPQKLMKRVVIQLLYERGYNIVAMERAFMGGIVDVLAQLDDSFIAVECGPCVVMKAIDYLMNENTVLWVVRPVGGYYEIFIVERDKSWNDFIKHHKNIELADMKRYVKSAFNDST